jgi:ribosome-binding protein aMBF1 (putative translation factor)
MGKTLTEGRKVGSGRKKVPSNIQSPAKKVLTLNTDEHFGEQLRRERERLGLKGIDIAERTNTSSGNVSHFEKGDNTYGNGSIQTVFKYAKALGYKEVKFTL